MPEVLPFSGVRYSDAPALADIVCPPYDVISPDDQEELHRRHPHNAVRLELAKDGLADRYAGARATYETWIRSGVLKREERQSFYVYRQDFTTPEGDPRRVAGVIGALNLEQFGRASGVLPHERTMPGPKRDRLALLEALPVNVSPIYAIYRGAGTLRPYLDVVAGRKPESDWVESGIRHRFWPVGSRAELHTISRPLRAGPIVIADGHHRYETALAFAGQDPAARHGGSVMTFCVDVDAEELMVLPYHRVLKTSVPWEALAELLEARFTCSRVAVDKIGEALVQSFADHSLGFVGRDDAILVELSERDVGSRLGNRAASWRALDVVALHEAVLPQLPDLVDDMTFSRDFNEVMEMVSGSEWTAGVLLRAVAPGAVVDVASSGERMPQKASYFWPKVPTGLVFHELDDVPTSS